MLIGVRLSERQARGQVFIPFHFREAAANLLTNPRLDPYAKIAEFKISAVKVVRQDGNDGKDGKVGKERMGRTGKTGKTGRLGVKGTAPRHPE
jgi:predicted molibdopterin-dependent oxidoreductase YjgC